jgi:plastocyanin
MRRSSTLIVLGLALCCCAWGAVGPAGAATAPAPATGARAPTHLLVYAQEWSLWPSRSWVPAGTVIVELWNRGQDAHDVMVRRLDARGQMVGRAQGVGVTQSGQIRTARWHLGRGKYELYCSMPGHMKLGMHARLTVR